MSFNVNVIDFVDVVPLFVVLLYELCTHVLIASLHPILTVLFPLVHDVLSPLQLPHTGFVESFLKLILQLLVCPALSLIYPVYVTLAVSSVCVFECSPVSDPIPYLLTPLVSSLLVLNDTPTFVVYHELSPTVPFNCNSQTGFFVSL